jgi:hypothetical protein
VFIGVSINLRTVLGIYGLTGPAATLPFVASGVVLLGWGLIGPYPLVAAILLS